MTMRQPQDPLRQDVKGQRRRQAWWPLYGLILMIAMAGIAIPLAPMVSEITLKALNPGVPKDTWTIIIGALIFFLLLMVAGMLFAIFAPKPAQSMSHISDREIDKQRKLLRAEIMARNDREKQTRRNISKARKEDNK